MYPYGFSTTSIITDRRTCFVAHDEDIPAISSQSFKAKV
jgi:hypothetical protein